MDELQFGFRNGAGTSEAVFSLNITTQRSRDTNVDIYSCFIDYNKASDRVKRQKLLEILKTAKLVVFAKRERIGTSRIKRGQRLTSVVL